MVGLSGCQMHSSYAFERLSIPVNGQDFHFYKRAITKFLPNGMNMNNFDRVKAGQMVETRIKTDTVFRQNLEANRVRYFDDAARRQTKVTVENGVLQQVGLGASGSKAKLSEGQYIFVIKEGELFATKKVMTVSGKIQHSSFFSGEDVSTAGKFSINSAGDIVDINNESGHYKPSKKHLDKSIDYLKTLNAYKDMPPQFLQAIASFFLQIREFFDQIFNFEHALDPEVIIRQRVDSDSLDGIIGYNNGTFGFSIDEIAIL